MHKEWYKLIKQLRALVILLMDNKLKGKLGACKTNNNSISGLKCVVPEPATRESEPVARVTL